VVLDGSGRVSAVRYADAAGAQQELVGLDAAVLALGPGGMRAVMAGSPALARAAPELSAAAGVGGVDVVTVRLWLDRYVVTDNPANVLSRCAALPRARTAPAAAARTRLFRHHGSGYAERLKPASSL
jgi:hypothetical protein